jgi:hypothetical protein
LSLVLVYHRIIVVLKTVIAEKSESPAPHMGWPAAQLMLSKHSKEKRNRHKTRNVFRFFGDLSRKTTEREIMWPSAHYTMARNDEIMQSFDSSFRASRKAGALC